MMEVVTILSIFFLNIVLPTLDTATVMIVVVRLYLGSVDLTGEDLSHPAVAALLLLPILLNYLVSWYIYLGRDRNIRYTFIFPLLNIYPQFGKNIISFSKLILSGFLEAFKLICSTYQDPLKGKKQRKEFDRVIGLHQPFLQSVPSALVMTLIMFTFKGKS